MKWTGNHQEDALVPPTKCELHTILVTSSGKFDCSRYYMILYYIVQFSAPRCEHKFTSAGMNILNILGPIKHTEPAVNRHQVEGMNLRPMMTHFDSDDPPHVTLS